MTDIDALVRELTTAAHNEALNGGEMRGTAPLLRKAAAAFLAARNETEAQAYACAKRLCVALANKHFPSNPNWEPLDDIMGVISQIDNMTTALVHKDKVNAVRNEALEEAAKVAEKESIILAGPDKPELSEFGKGILMHSQQVATAIRDLKEAT